MEQRLSVAQAKQAFSECIRKVEAGGVLLITRHGRPVAALVSAEDLERIERLRKAGPQSGLASIAGGWENSEELVQILEDSPRFGQKDAPSLD
jgi:prevent-host-death family protein